MGNEESGSDNPRSPVQAIVNAVDTLDFISHSNRGAGVRELSRELRLTRGTAERVLNSLLCCELLQQDAETGRYFMGRRILEIAAQYQRNLSIGAIARRHMDGLVRETNESVFLGVLDQDHVTIVDHIESPQPLRFASGLGMREPVYCTALGKIIMAQLPTDACASLLQGKSLKRFTPNTLIGAEEILEAVAHAKSRGWATDDEEFHEGVRCVAAAVFGVDGRVTGAISVSGPVFRINDAELPRIAQLVMAAAAAISKDLGYSPRALGSHSA